MNRSGFRSLRQILKVRAKVRRPEDIDRIATRNGAISYLMNPHLAGPMDLTNLGLGTGAFVPVLISKRSGGRKSTFQLKRGESIVVGALISEKGITLRSVRRDTGRSKIVAVGDALTETWQTLDGKTLVVSQMNVVHADYKTGVLRSEGTVVNPRGLLANKKTVVESTSNIWSCCTKTTTTTTP